MSKNNIAILLLAAGESKRMGATKQLLPWGNSNVLTHAINNIKKIQENNVFVVLGANAIDISNEINFSNLMVRPIENKNWKEGLGTSLAYGIKNILAKCSKIEAVLICLADQPLVTAENYTKLIENFKKGRNMIVASNHDSRAGVPAIFDKSIMVELCNLRADIGARVIIEKYANKTVLLNIDGVEYDIDTPTEYKKLYNAHH